MLTFNKSTMIALCAMYEIAKAGGEPVASTWIAETYGVSKHHVAKVLQRLVRAGYLRTTRGVGGGCRLAQDPKNVTLMDVVAAFEGPRPHAPDGGPHAVPGHGEAAGARALGALLREMEEQVAFTLDSISLKTLVKHSASST